MIQSIESAGRAKKPVGWLMSFPSGSSMAVIAGAIATTWMALAVTEHWFGRGLSLLVGAIALFTVAAIFFFQKRK
jgi:hypothetical protein